MVCVPPPIPVSASSKAWHLWSFCEIRSFEEGAKNTSRKAWKDGDGFAATVVALLFSFLRRMARKSKIPFVSGARGNAGTSISEKKLF